MRKNKMIFIVVVIIFIFTGCGMNKVKTLLLITSN